MLIYQPFFPFRSTGLSQLSYRYDLISREIPQLLRVKKPVEDLGLHLDYIDALAHFTGTKLVDRWVGGFTQVQQELGFLEGKVTR